MARPNTVTYLLGSKFHKMAYVEFGDPAAEPVLCVHGLTRTGRDFDALAQALADSFMWCAGFAGARRVGLAGARGIISAADLRAGAVAFAGGDRPAGAVGGHVARRHLWHAGCGVRACADNPPGVERYRPIHAGGGAKRIRDYIGRRRSSPDAGAEAYLSEVHAPFGKFSDANGPYWRAICPPGADPTRDARRLHYDPTIVVPCVDPGRRLWISGRSGRRSSAGAGDRGAESDLLLPDTFERMKKAGAKTYIVPGRGMPRR